MKTNSFPTMRSRRGTILTVTAFITVLSAIAIIYIAMSTSSDKERLGTRHNDLSRAYFAAKAGVQQVLNWGNHPDQYDTSIPAMRRLFYRDSNGEFPNLTATLAEGEYLISTIRLGTFTSKYGDAVASVKSITLIPANSATDPTTCSFKVRSVGLTPAGVQQTVVAYIRMNPSDTTRKLSAGKAGAVFSVALQNNY
jgi:hypothetical protein